MSTPSFGNNKCTLRSLHQEIDLLDRKLAHMARYDLSPAGPARDAVEHKLVQQREKIEKKARQMMVDGVSYIDSDLPRSFRPATPATVLAGQSVTEKTLMSGLAAKVPGLNSRQERRHPLAFAGTSLDGDAIAAYLRDRRKS